jgi:predicted metal-dependent HD superfamily phosphohydrolase
MPSPQRWLAMWHALSGQPQGQLYDQIVAHYSERHRHYHTARHLDDCFAHFDEIGHLAAHPAEVALALWFHDAIYEPRRQDNEERSADWARASALAAGVAAANADRVHALIMATRHDALPASVDEQVLVDIDLAILGAPPARFDEYEREVRAEYAWIPDFLFRAKRKEILQAFLARPAIYSTAPMLERLEARAQANLARSLSHN